MSCHQHVILDLHGVSVLTRIVNFRKMADVTQLLTLTTSEVAARFRVDSSAVRRWVKDGKLTPSITTPGGHYRFNAQDVEAFERSA